MTRISEIARTIGWAGLVSFSSLLAAWVAIAWLWSGDVRLALVFQVVAFLLDTADGFLARKLGTASEFGRQLDSMIDAMNYSLFAALVTAHVLLPGPLGLVVGFLILALGILRLILFNINGYGVDGETLFYHGIVTPHLTLATGLLYAIDHWWSIPAGVSATILTVLALGQLSRIRTRKTGALLFWIPVATFLGLGALLWL